MSKDRVIKPGQWWIVRFRRVESFDQVTGYMTCKNRYHAGHNGWSRKSKVAFGKKRYDKDGNRCRRLVPRKWDLKGRFAYRFAGLSDLKTSIRSKEIREWVVKWDGILEIVECEGCLHYGTITSEKVVERIFPPKTNEMEILALECAMGE